MKSFLVSFVLLASTMSFACIGGNLKSLTIKSGGKDVELAQVDMSRNRVKVIDNSSELVTIGWSPKGSQVFGGICGFNRKTCDYDQAIGIELTKQREGKLFVTIKRKSTTYNFTATNFAVTREIGGCGQTIFPDGK